MQHKANVLYRLALAAMPFIFVACSSGNTATTPVSSREPKSSPGFFDRLTDQMSARECNVGRFTCPFGLGPAGEPCECIGPGGVVFNGRTVK
jgi:hypothetical protein